MYQKTNAHISHIRKLESRKTNSIAQDQRENLGYIKETVGKIRNRFSLQLPHRSPTATPFF